MGRIKNKMRNFNVHLNYQQSQKIVVFHGWIIDGVKLNGQLFGGNGGNKTVIHLNPGEKITRVHGTRCIFENKTVVGQITFVTSNGAHHGPFGHNGDPHRHHHNHIVDSFNHVGHGHDNHHGHGHGHGNGHGHGHGQNRGTDIDIGPMHIHFGGQGHQHGHRHHGHNQGHGSLHNFHGQCFQRFLHTFHAN